MIQAFKQWVWREGRLEVLVLTGLLLTVAGLWIFGLVAADVMDGDTQKFDNRLLLALRKPGDLAVPIGPGWTVQVARDLTAFGGPVGLGIVTAVVSGYLLLQRRFGLLAFVLASVLSGTLLALVLKDWFRRPRPQVVPHLTGHRDGQLPERTFHVVLADLPDARRVAGARRARSEDEAVFSSGRVGFVRADRLQPRLPRRSLSHGRAGGMVRGQYLGAGLLPGGAFQSPRAACCRKPRNFRMKKPPVP